MREPLSSAVAKQAQVAGQIPGQVITRDRQTILNQPRISCGKTSYCLALPYADGTVLRYLCTNKKIRRFCQETRTSEYLSGHKPEQAHFLALRRNNKITSSALDH